MGSKSRLQHALLGSQANFHTYKGLRKEEKFMTEAICSLKSLKYVLSGHLQRTADLWFGALSLRGLSVPYSALLGTYLFTCAFHPNLDFLVSFFYPGFFHSPEKYLHIFLTLASLKKASLFGQNQTSLSLL